MSLHRRQLLRRSAALALPVLPSLPLAWLAGCATVGSPTVITLGETELGVLVNRAFPLQRRLYELLDVTLSAPALRLQPERNRLAVALDIAAQERLFSKAAKGRLAFDGALRYEPGDASVRLQQVRVSQFSLEGGAAIPGAVAAALPPAAAPAPGAGASAPASVGQRLGQSLAERMLENLSIYKISPERLASLRQLGLQPGAVTVTARGVEITLARAG
ncbi:hypothetical protein AACH10_18115 [Ideonella sp. DXS22W]|uniref:DUF1439 domain-containing protein n=1 Tax=Pseudaquabacterium inlustre TaxID=2984192 RepID=A0ABU9CKH7_9BURK